VLDSTLTVLTVLAAIGCGIVGGVFFAFSAFIMPAFARLTPANGIAAMQSINITVLTPAFLSVFMGSAVMAVIAAGASLMDFGGNEGVLRITGALLYVIGVIFVTGALNVPHNNQLKEVEPENRQDHDVWDRYLREWTTWNTVRTIASIVACLAFFLALVAD